MSDRGNFTTWFNGANSVADAIMVGGIATGDVFEVDAADTTDPSWIGGTATYNGTDELDAGELTSGWWTLADWDLQPAATAITATGTSTGTTSLTLAGVAGGTIVAGMSVAGTGVPAGLVILGQISGTAGGAGVYLTSKASTLSAVTLTFTATSSFPAFAPILPPPLVGQGSGSTPPFPPPSIPPPAGPLVGPAIAPAGVPPSTAGITQPQFKTGSATSPAIATFFPAFTTSGWPVPPVQITNTPPPTMLPTSPRPVNATGIP